MRITSKGRTPIALAIAATVALAACSGSSSSLTGKTWQLTALTRRVAHGFGAVPAADQANYTIEFKPDGNYQAKADCNQTSGRYATTSNGGLTIEPGPTTVVACPAGSLSDEYIQGLTDASSSATVDGQLTITLKDGWTLNFK
jgi:heat shock protein HslJ